MDKKVVIRVDGGNKIGLGHLSRCLALAHIIKIEFEIVFYISYGPDSFIKRITNEGFSVNKISEGDAWLNTLPINSIIILDGYHFAIALHKKIRNLKHKLVIIDDVYDKPIDADVIINYSPYAINLNYLKSEETTLALGIEYLILNNKFLNIARQEYSKDKNNQAFICLGGSDSQNYTEVVLKRALKKKFAEQYFVILGPSYKYEESIYSIAKQVSNIKIIKSPSQNEIINIMLKCDKAICASGTLSFEYICTGGLLGVVKVAENQSDIFKFLMANNLAFDFLKENKIKFSSDKMIFKQKKLIDGNSPSRIIKLFNSLL